MIRDQNNGTHSPTRDRVQAFLNARPDLTYDIITQHTNLAIGTGRRFLSGLLPESETIRGEFKRVLDMAERGEIMRLGSQTAVTIPATDPVPRRVSRKGDFYETATVRQVASVLDYCSERSAIGVITGNFGAGKTEAVKHWRKTKGRKIDNAVLEFNSFSSSNMTEFLFQLSEVLGASGTGPSGPTNGYAGAGLFRRVCQRLSEAPALLILDQCEMVSVRVFQLVRQIWDRTREDGVGIVLLAAPVLLKRMFTSGAQDLGALTSRVGVWAGLTGLSKAEMADILKKEGITEITDDALDLLWRAIDGSMRRLMGATELLKSRHAGKKVGEKTIAGVAGHLWGMHIDAGGEA